ncbi:unnamed protein product [Amoebophrya sp. A120]|nr:unnamed protein product [Amoebophrya sp. A120]|eukprot:GSA120T00016366001.1
MANAEGPRRAFLSDDVFPPPAFSEHAALERWATKCAPGYLEQLLAKMQNKLLQKVLSEKSTVSTSPARGTLNTGGNNNAAAAAGGQEDQGDPRTTAGVLEDTSKNYRTQLFKRHAEHYHFCDHTVTSYSERDEQSGAASKNVKNNLQRCINVVCKEAWNERRQLYWNPVVGKYFQVVQWFPKLVTTFDINFHRKDNNINTELSSNVPAQEQGGAATRTTQELFLTPPRTTTDLELQEELIRPVLEDAGDISPPLRTASAARKFQQLMQKKLDERFNYRSSHDGLSHVGEQLHDQHLCSGDKNNVGTMVTKNTSSSSSAQKYHNKTIFLCFADEMEKAQITLTIVSTLHSQNLNFSVNWRSRFKTTFIVNQGNPALFEGKIVAESFHFDTNYNQDNVAHGGAGGPGTALFLSSGASGSSTSSTNAPVMNNAFQRFGAASSNSFQQQQDDASASSPTRNTNSSRNHRKMLLDPRENQDYQLFLQKQKEKALKHWNAACRYAREFPSSVKLQQMHDADGVCQQVVDFLERQFELAKRKLAAKVAGRRNDFQQQQERRGHGAYTKTSDADTPQLQDEAFLVVPRRAPGAYFREPFDWSGKNSSIQNDLQTALLSRLGS